MRLQALVYVPQSQWQGVAVVLMAWGCIFPCVCASEQVAVSEQVAAFGPFREMLSPHQIRPIVKISGLRTSDASESSSGSGVLPASRCLARAQQRFDAWALFRQVDAPGGLHATAAFAQMAWGVQLPGYPVMCLTRS